MQFWKAAMAAVLMAGFSIVPVGCDDPALDDSTSNDAGNDGNDGAAIADLRSAWTLTYTWHAPVPQRTRTATVTLAGSETGGAVAETSDTGNSIGTWSYDAGGNFGMILSGNATYTGYRSDNTTPTILKLEGTMHDNGNQRGSFTMTRR